MNQFPKYLATSEKKHHPELKYMNSAMKIRQIIHDAILSNDNRIELYEVRTNLSYDQDTFEKLIDGLAGELSDLGWTLEKFDHGGIIYITCCEDGVCPFTEV